MKLEIKVRKVNGYWSAWVYGQRLLGASGKTEAEAIGKAVMQLAQYPEKATLEVKIERLPF